MTTIAWDGYTLAADKQITYGNAKQTVTKIFKTPIGLIAYCGRLLTCLEIKDYILNHNPLSQEDQIEYPIFKEDDNSEVYVISLCSDKIKIENYGSSKFPIIIEDKILAIGSGADYARAAMYCGKTAKEAVEIACLFDISSGMGIDILNFEDDSSRSILQVKQESENYNLNIDQSKELLRRLRLCCHHPDLEDEDRLLLSPILTLYRDENPRNLNSILGIREIEIIQSIFEKYY